MLLAYKTRIPVKHCLSVSNTTCSCRKEFAHYVFVSMYSAYKLNTQTDEISTLTKIDRYGKKHGKLKIKNGVVSDVKN